jgi:ribosomal protein S18 acetylase RimI-like enzyme
LCGTLSTFLTPLTMGGMPQVDATIEASPVLDMGEVVELYREVGWMTYADDAATLEAALAGSSRVVAARVDGRLVGLARVISDGATICYLQDLLVHPDTQRGGVGQALVRAALEPYALVRQKVLLTDNESGQRAFYESLGFRETQDHDAGSLQTFVRFDG